MHALLPAFTPAMAQSSSAQLPCICLLHTTAQSCSDEENMSFFFTIPALSTFRLDSRVDNMKNEKAKPGC